MVSTEKIEKRANKYAYYVVSLLMIGGGYYLLSLGLKGAINFGDEYTYYNKLAWFFIGISLISAPAFIIGYRKFRYKVLSFFITWMSQYFGYTMTRGVAFDATIGAFEITPDIISQGALIITIIAILILIGFYFIHRSKS